MTLPQGSLDQPLAALMLETVRAPTVPVTVKNPRCCAACIVLRAPMTSVVEHE